jgi:hypothetical protein
VIDGCPNQFVMVGENGQVPLHVGGLVRYGFFPEPSRAG